MTSRTLTLQEFAELLDHYGADPAAWPAAKQSAVRALLAESPEAIDLMAAAREAEAMLREPPVKAPAGLAERIMTASGAARPLKKKNSA